MKYAYWILSAGALGLLALDAPSGSALTTSPEVAKVQAAKPTKNKTVRGRGPAFIWLGGGYHGGK